MRGVKQQQSREEKKRTLKVYTPENVHGEIIGKISSSFYYVNHDERVDEVADELNLHEDIFAVGVVNEEKEALGGDFYSIQRYAQGRWILSICDVAGKGMPAALISVLLGGMSSIFNFRSGLKEYLIRLNEYIYNTFKLESFVTGIFVDFDDTTGKMQIFDIGHSYCFLYRDGQLIQMKTRDDIVPIGVREVLDLRGNIYTLVAGDMLILLTDGIEEQKNPRGEVYGIKRLYRVIKKHSDNVLKRIKDELISDHELFRENQPQRDDMTMIFLLFTDETTNAT